MSSLSPKKSKKKSGTDPETEHDYGNYSASTNAVSYTTYLANRYRMHRKFKHYSQLSITNWPYSAHNLVDNSKDVQMTDPEASTFIILPEAHECFNSAIGDLPVNFVPLHANSEHDNFDKCDCYRANGRNPSDHVPIDGYCSNGRGCKRRGLGENGRLNQTRTCGPFFQRILQILLTFGAHGLLVVMYGLLFVTKNAFRPDEIALRTLPSWIVFFSRLFYLILVYLMTRFLF